MHFFEYLSCFALLLMILMNANLFSVSNLSIRFQRRFTKDSCSCSKAFSSSTFSRRSCTNMKKFKVHWDNGLFRSKCLPLLYQMAVSWSEHKCKHLCYFYVLRFFSSLLITIILNSCMLINFFLKIHFHMSNCHSCSYNKKVDIKINIILSTAV